MPRLYYLPDNQEVNVDEFGTILESSLCAGIPHTHVCGGSARCSTCRVWVVEGLEYCAPRNDAEQAVAQRLQLDSRIRLACQTQVFGGGKITLRRLALDAEDLELMHQQITGGAKIGAIGEEKTLAILFADLRAFTTFAEMLPAYDVIYLLNRYFKCMGAAIAQYGGLINSYMGDGLMALFGYDDPDRIAERAVRAAVAMEEAMAQFNLYLENFYQRSLRIGIGIHCGPVVLGAVGASPQSQHMTAIGDAVNLASRIEAANKRLGTTLLISEATFTQVSDIVTVQPHEAVTLPGKSGTYSLYEVTGVTGHFVAKEKSAIARYHRPSLPRLASVQTRLTQLWQWMLKALKLKQAQEK